MINNRLWANLILVVFAAMIIGLGATVVSGNENIVLQVTPQGEADVVLEWGQTYDDAGATAALYLPNGQSHSLEVTTRSNLDAQKVGTYWICYETRYDRYMGTAYRRVRVVDTQPPEITFAAESEQPTTSDDSYQETFTAIDNYDGDLTDCVNWEVNNREVTYTVADSSGNITSVTRPIRRDDTVPPELTLLGNTNMILNVGSTYRESGYTATDDCDGDISSRVTITGKVDTFCPGRYKLTYTVQDSFSNTTTATRSVFVKSPEVKRVNDPSKTDKVVYLTFDDGPGPDTDRLLDILEKYNVQATFFVVNTKMIDTVERIAEEGHTVGIHTATHRFHDIYASEEAYFADLYEMQQIIESYTGQTPMLMRFPGGSSNTISRFNRGIMTRLTAQVEELGFTYFDWNVDSNDSGGSKTSSEVYDNVINGISRKEAPVVLMHDIKSYTVDAVEAIIIWGIDNGYTFLPLDENSPTCHHDVNN